MTSPGPAVLVTGADGYLGRLLLRGWLEHSDLHVVATVRCSDAAGLAARTERLHGAVGKASRARLRVIPADVAAADAFEAVEPALRASITRIVHTAAVTRFDVDRQVAEVVNVGGTESVARLARRCPNLEAAGLCSTLYAAGLRRGTVAEEPLDGQGGFANHYEWSKQAAEGRALAVAPDVPWRIMRLATVICDDAGGKVTQHNAFHTTLRLCFHGLLPVLPGAPNVPLYLVSGMFCADVVRRLVDPTVADGIYHVTHDVTSAVTLGHLLELAFEAFSAAPTARRRQVTAPPFVDLESFELLASGPSGSRRPMLRQMLDGVRPFAPQLFAGKDFRCSRLEQAVPVTPAPPSELAEAALASLVATQWGTNDVAA